MNVLVIGGAGRMGPWVEKALTGRHTLTITDVTEAADTSHDYRQMSADDYERLLDLASGMDAIINLAAVRWDVAGAFNVNVVGCFNIASVAAAHGIRRIVNTGAYMQVAGPRYEQWDFQLTPDMPPHPGVQLYPLTKALGYEILRVFSERHDMYVQTLLFGALRRADTFVYVRDPRLPDDPDRPEELGEDMVKPFTTAWADTGTAVRAALEVELARLPSRCEAYFVLPETPHGKYNGEKMYRILGWRPRYHLEALWTKNPQSASYDSE